MSDTNPTKQSVRQSALAARDAMPAQARIEAGLKLCEYAADLGIASGAMVSGFFPIRSEIDVRPLMASLEALGTALCLPVVIDSETIEFRKLVRDAELVEAGFGTFGPGPDAPIVDPDVLLVPLAAFDGSGNRIGYGAGFYDRAIAKLEAKGLSPKLIGVAFESQRVKVVPTEAHDVQLHTLLTENGLYEFKRTGQD